MHFEFPDAVAKAAEKNPRDPTPLFLVGVYLYFDGQANRAEAFFQRALELARQPAERRFLEARLGQLTMS